MATRQLGKSLNLEIITLVLHSFQKSSSDNIRSHLQGLYTICACLDLIQEHFETFAEGLNVPMIKSAIAPVKDKE